MSKEASTQESENGKSLEDFTWDNEDFFGIPAQVESSQKVIDEIADDDKSTEKETEKSSLKEPEDEEDENEDELFSDNAQKAAGEKEEEDEEENDDSEFFTTLSKELTEKKIFQHVKLAEGEKIDEEKFFELQNEEVEGRVEEAIQDFITQVGDEDGAAFIKFKKAGGRTADFFEFYSSVSGELDVDIEKESGQDAVLRKWYKTIENLDDEDIEDKLDWLKEGGKKKKYAEKYLLKMEAETKSAKDKFLNDQLEAQTERENAKKAFSTNLKTTLDTTDAVGDFVFSKAEKPSLMDYILKPAVKLKTNQYLTQFQSDLNEIVKGDPQKLLILAKLLKTKFDTSDMIVKQKTEAVKKVKSTLASKSSQLSSVNNSKRKSLIDHF